MTQSSLTVSVIGAGGKMGMRISANLEKSNYRVLYSDSYPAAQDRVRAAGRELTDNGTAAQEGDVVVLAVPDVVLGEVSRSVVPLMRPGSLLLTLDPAAACAGQVAERDDVPVAVAHPCHPSVFLERTSKEEWADTFGGMAAPQNVVAALTRSPDGARARLEEVVRTIYAPVLDVHWVTVRQLAILEPTLVETVTCMISGLLKDALWETVHTAGVPAEAAEAMLFGHIQVALTNSLRGSNPFSDACHIAMTYGRRTIVKDDWKRIFDDSELDGVLAEMLHLKEAGLSAGPAPAGSAPLSQ